MLQGGAEAALGSYRYIVFKFLGQFQSFPLSSTIAHWNVMVIKPSTRYLVLQIYDDHVWFKCSDILGPFFNNLQTCLNYSKTSKLWSPFGLSIISLIVRTTDNGRHEVAEQPRGRGGRGGGRGDESRRRHLGGRHASTRDEFLVGDVQQRGGRHTEPVRREEDVRRVIRRRGKPYIVAIIGWWKLLVLNTSRATSLNNELISTGKDSLFKVFSMITSWLSTLAWKPLGPKIWRCQ